LVLPEWIPAYETVIEGRGNMSRRMALAAAGLVVGVLAAAPAVRGLSQAPATAGVPRFEVDRSFPSLPAGKVLGDMSSVAVDAQDHVWMIHRPRTVPAEQRSNAASAVLEFDASGKFIAGWGGPSAGYEWPEREHGIYVDPGGSVWISGNNGYGTPPPPGNSDDMLLKFTPAGKFLLQIGHSGKSTGDADKENVKQAADMHVFKPSNELFVADGYGNHRVAVFDAGNGMFKRTWGANGGTPFNIVHSIRVSNDGLVYVADRGNKRVQVFTTAGEFKQQLAIGADTPAMQTAAGLAFSPDRAQQFLYVADLGNNQIVIVNRKAMSIIGAFGKGGTGPGEFGTVHEIASDSKGNLYSAELRTKRVQKFVLK
jgi:DNA-binding beta-propeller fold protein YncE